MSFMFESMFGDSLREAAERAANNMNNIADKLNNMAEQNNRSQYRQKKPDNLNGLKILPDRDYKSITCLRDHSLFKKQPTRDIAQCFVIEDAQIILS